MLRKIMAIFVSLVFVPVFLICLTTFTTNKVLLNPQTYIKELNKVNFYQKLSESTANYVDNYLKNSQELSDSSNIDLSKFSKDLIKPQWIKLNLEMVIGNFLDYLSGKSKSLNGVIDFTDLKLQINNSATNSIVDKISSLPDCTQEQLKNSKVDKISDLQCRPPGMDENKIKDELTKSLNNEPMLALPDKYPLASTLDYLGKNLGNRLVLMLPKISSYTMLISLASSIILLLIIGLLISRPFYRILRWFAILFLIGGLLYLFSSLIPLILSYSLKSIIQSANLNFPELNQFISAVLINHLTINIIVVSAVVIAVSIGLFIIAKSMAAKALDK